MLNFAVDKHAHTSSPTAFSLFNSTTMIFNFLLFNILFFFVFGTSTEFVYSFPNNFTDQQALLSFKSSITDDPSGVLHSWNNSIHFCHWTGVTCSRRRQRVTLLNLSSLHLAGTLSPHIGNLSFLRTIYLYRNRFHGLIPNEIGRLFRLQYLSLGNNSFEGGFPDYLHRCVDIKFINLDNNRLKGELPTEFASWSKLDLFSVSNNHFSGSIPDSIGNISSLRSLYLDSNDLRGSIPNEIGRLFSLQNLYLAFNSFEGAIPADLHHCTDIRYINLDNNHLEGELPTEFASWSKLDLFSVSNNHFSGSIPASIGNMSSLRSLYLARNDLRGSIPNEIGRLFRLQNLYLAFNSFEGAIPADLHHCTDIRYINLDNNHLEAELPTEFASWSKLDLFSVSHNHFCGSIPPSIGNLSSLRSLYLSRNNLEGGIPLEVAHLAKLEILDLSENRLSGMVPLPLYNFSYLSVFGLDQNVLEGTLPSDFDFTLPKLQEFYIGGNRFSGPLPPSIANVSNLVIFDIVENNITGPIPNNLGSLPNLQWLGLGPNPLGESMRPNDWSFFNSLVNCTRLKILGLGETSLRGELPNSIANLSTTMEKLYMEDNYIYGRIPHGIGKLVNMIILHFGDNLLTGSIPESIGRLSKLGELDLRGNNISGVIPTSITNITQLVRLILHDNMLQGSIQTLHNLQTLSLSYNRLDGVISEQIVGPLSSQCVFLYLEENLFTGHLPSNIGSLKHLVHLSIFNNKLTGDIPVTLGDCVMLEQLNMGGNLFQGKIPSSFKALKSLVFLDLSSNNISGEIPSFFDGFSLIQFLNLSHNKLGGEVPREGLFSNVSVFSIVGNLELCGGTQALRLPACPKKVSTNKKKAFTLRIILIIVLVPLGMLLACFTLIFYRRQNSKKLNDPVIRLKDDQYPKVSYQDLLLATNEFSLENLLGEGRYGSVYKGVLESVEHIVAVKVLNVEVRGANKSFLAECETLRNIRHRNLIKIITACSSIDFKGSDFKALVFEFVTNGNLDSWLHPSPDDQENQRNLTLLQRINISIDVALGVDYLHHHSHASIIHCDLKPSNILLDEDFVARIGDFGLARFCFSATTSDMNQAQMSSTGVRGTVGYVPPEYGMGGEISAEGDVYSYGILLLEMFSGKRPTESCILMDNDNNLHDFVRKALPQRVMDIVDPRIVLDQEEHGMPVNRSYSKAAMEVCLTSIFEVGILCSEETPKKRIDISVAIKKLHLARNKLLERRQ